MSLSMPSSKCRGIYVEEKAERVYKLEVVGDSKEAVSSRPTMMMMTKITEIGSVPKTFTGSYQTKPQH